VLRKCALPDSHPRGEGSLDGVDHADRLERLGPVASRANRVAWGARRRSCRNVACTPAIKVARPPAHPLRSKGHLAQLLDRLSTAWSLCLRSGLFDRALRLRLARLRVDEHPAWRDAP